MLFPSSSPEASAPTRASAIRLLCLLALLAGSGVLLAGVGWRVWRAGEPARAAADVLRIGYAVEAPYAYVDPTGRVTGEGPEIARVVAERIGRGKIVWRQTEFGSLVQELREGTIDAIASGLFITPERSRQVAFSRPTFRVRAGLLVAKGNPLALHSYADVVERRARVAVLARSFEEAHFLGRPGWHGARVVVVSEAGAGVLALESGAVDAFALSAPSLQWMLRQGGVRAVELAEPFAAPADAPGPAEGGFAFRLEDRELRAAWDRALDDFLGSDEHRRLVAPFGFTAAELPDGPGGTGPRPPDHP